MITDFGFEIVLPRVFFSFVIQSRNAAGRSGMIPQNLHPLVLIHLHNIYINSHQYQNYHQGFFNPQPKQFIHQWQYFTKVCCKEEINLKFSQINYLTMSSKKQRKDPINQIYPDLSDSDQEPPNSKHRPQQLIQSEQINIQSPKISVSAGQKRERVESQEEKEFLKAQNLLRKFPKPDEQASFNQIPNYTYEKPKKREYFPRNQENATNLKSWEEIPSSEKIPNALAEGQSCSVFSEEKQPSQTYQNNRNRSQTKVYLKNIPFFLQDENNLKTYFDNECGSGLVWKILVRGSSAEVFFTHRSCCEKFLNSKPSIVNKSYIKFGKAYNQIELSSKDVYDRIINEYQRYEDEKGNKELISYYEQKIAPYYGFMLFLHNNKHHFADEGTINPISAGFEEMLATDIRVCQDLIIWVSDEELILKKQVLQTQEFLKEISATYQMTLSFETDFNPSEPIGKRQHQFRLEFANLLNIDPKAFYLVIDSSKIKKDDEKEKENRETIKIKFLNGSQFLKAFIYLKNDLSGQKRVIKPSVSLRFIQKIAQQSHQISQQVLKLGMQYFESQKAKRKSEKSDFNCLKERILQKREQKRKQAQKKAEELLQ